MNRRLTFIVLIIFTSAFISCGKAIPKTNPGATNPDTTNPGTTKPQLLASELYISNPETGTVSVVDSLSFGDPIPIRNFGNMIGLKGMAVDAISREAFLASSNNSIVVYPPDANESSLPERIISGPSTGLYYPSDIAVDTINNELYVLNRSNITIYPKTANDDAPPSRIISIDNAKYGYPYYMAVDSANSEIFLVTGVSIYDKGSPSQWGTYYYIIVLSATANGLVEPLRTNFLGWDQTGFSVKALAVDPIYDELYLGHYSSIGVYSRSDGGKLREISGDKTISLKGIAINRVHAELYFTSSNTFGGTYAVGVFPIMASGNTTPIRTIDRFSGLNNPGGIVFVNR